MIPWFHKIGSMVQWFHACMQRFRGSRGLTALQQPQAACAASQFFLGSRYFSYQTHGFFTTASFGTSIFRLQLLYLSVQRNGFTCRFQALKHRPLAFRQWYEVHARVALRTIFTVPDTTQLWFGDSIAIHTYTRSRWFSTAFQQQLICIPLVTSNTFETQGSMIIYVTSRSGNISEWAVDLLQCACHGQWMQRTDKSVMHQDIHIPVSTARPATLYYRKVHKRIAWWLSTDLLADGHEAE